MIVQNMVKWKRFMKNFQTKTEVLPFIMIQDSGNQWRYEECNKAEMRIKYEDSNYTRSKS